jgi:DNA repair exonuclease SbcCD nuclease subunit
MKTPIAILTADIHARNTVPRCRVDDFVAAQRRKLEYIRSTALEGGRCWLDAGDLFHSWKSSQETEIMLLEILRGFTFCSIPGNHEIPYHNIERLNSSSFGVLKAAGTIHSIAPADVLPVEPPFYSGIRVRTAGLWIYILHGMVWPDKPPMAAMEGIAAAEVLALYPDANVILTGHNHETFVVEAGNQKLVNPGSVMRAAIDQIEHRPCFFILYSDGSTRQEFIPCDADVFAAEAYEKAGAREDRMTAFVERVQNTEGFALSFEDNLKAYCQQNQVGPAVRQEIHIAMEAKQ